MSYLNLKDLSFSTKYNYCFEQTLVFLNRCNNKNSCRTKHICNWLNYRFLGHLLTVHIHSDWLYSWGPQAILYFTVILTSLMSLNICNPQSLGEDTWVLESVRGTSCCFGPPDLSKHPTKIVALGWLSHWKIK